MYLNAEKVLPKQLVREIQRYVDGVEVYIPKKSKTRFGWGESIPSLMDKYHLSYDSIRKIVSPYRKE